MGNDYINSCGTLGDAFIILCKVYDKKISKINHYTKHNKQYDTIVKILKLKEDITINTLDERPSNPISGCIEDGETYNPFPNINLPDISGFELPNDYIVVQLQSGISIDRTPWKQLRGEDLSKIPRDKKIVLVGVDNKNHNFLDAIDLRNKTNILEVLSVINGASSLYGPVGLFTLFGPARKVNTTAFIKHTSDDHAMKQRSGKIKEWNKYIKYVK